MRYIAMAGLHGCIPQCIEDFDDHNSAVDYLVSVHEIGINKTRELRRDNYVELSLKYHGNEYAMIEIDDSGDPAIHEDN